MPPGASLRWVSYASTISEMESAPQFSVRAEARLMPRLLAREIRSGGGQRASVMCWGRRAERHYGCVRQGVAAGKARDQRLECPDGRLPPAVGQARPDKRCRHLDQRRRGDTAAIRASSSQLTSQGRQAFASRARVRLGLAIDDSSKRPFMAVDESRLGRRRNSRRLGPHCR